MIITVKKKKARKKFKERLNNYLGLYRTAIHPEPNISQPAALSTALNLRKFLNFRKILNFDYVNLSFTLYSVLQFCGNRTITFYYKQ